MPSRWERVKLLLPHLPVLIGGRSTASQEDTEMPKGPQLPLAGDEADDLLNLLTRLEKAGFYFKDYIKSTGEVVLRADDESCQVTAVGLRAAIEAAETVGQIKPKWEK